MNTLTKTTTGIVTALVIASAAALAATKTDSVGTELIEFNDRFNEVAASYDATAFLSLYDVEPLWIAPGKAPVTGQDVPKATFEFFSTNKGSLTHTLDHTFHSDDGSQAVMVGQYDLKVDSVGVQATGTYQFVLERSDDNWKIISDMYNQHEAAQ